MNASVQVWAKGFDGGGRSGEFDLIVPSSNRELTGIELKLTRFEDWGAIIEPLYKLGGTTLARQFVALFAPAEFLVASVSPSSDGHGRPSIVVVAATVNGIDWRERQLAHVFSSAHALSSRLAKRYGETMAGAPHDVGEQLRANGFLPDRDFALESESPTRHIDWEAVSAEVRRWKGVTGVGTPTLAALGANVLYGTRDEIDLGRTNATEGVFDVARARIEPIGSGLELWEEFVSPEEKAPLEPEPVSAPASVEPMEELNRNVGTIVDVVINIRDALLDLLGPDDARRRGKRKKR